MNLKLFILILLIFSNIVLGQTNSAVDKIVKNEIETLKTPGLGVAVIKSGKINHLKTYGKRDVENKLPIEKNTSFHIASVSKTIITLAIFKLWEEGKIDLHTDINKYLPFKVQNPHFPKEKITIEELLNHRSGLRDNMEIFTPFWSNPQGDSKVNLSTFLKDYLTPEGKIFDKTKNFSAKENRKSYAYSNTGFALLGLIIEQVSSLSLEKFSQKHIFLPLKMKNTSWFLKYLDTSKVAKTYTNKNSQLIFRGHNGYPDYPAGQLRSSIADFTNLILGLLNSDKNNFIIQGKTANKILPDPVYGHRGFFTWYLGSYNGRLYYYHDGMDLGTRSIVVVDVKRKNAIILFINAETRLSKLWRKIATEVF